MWEFSLNIKSENVDIINKVYDVLKKYFDLIDGLVTLHEENGYTRILIATQKDKKELAERVISSCIVDVICNDYKMSFIDRFLFIPCQDKIGALAFKKALLNFDNETDKFIVKKALDLKSDIFLDSFYHFKLKTLKSKWTELIALANENKEYLLSDESFLDLLKFLVDNLDIGEDEISIVKEEDGYRIYTDNEYSIGVINEENIVSSVIDLSPQKINLYVSENNNAMRLLKIIFADRISINKISFQNIKKIKLNH